MPLNTSSSLPVSRRFGVQFPLFKQLGGTQEGKYVILLLDTARPIRAPGHTFTDREPA